MIFSGFTESLFCAIIIKRGLIFNDRRNNIMSQSKVRIEILHFHRILLAHTHTAENYAYSLSSREIGRCENDYIYGGVIEIGFVEKNPLAFRDEKGELHIAKVGDVFIIPPMRKFEVFALEPETHRHVTTEAIIDCRINVKDNSPSVLELPLIISAGPRSERICSAIRRAANKSSPAGTNDYFRQCADFMRILEELEAFDPNTQNTVPSQIRYCREAERFIINNIDKKLKVEEIADAIGISKNYLTNIFSSTRGMPIIEYINRQKLSHMTELMLRFNYSVREAGEYVGLDNVNYISRMFRKYYGVTISEYRRSLL